MNSMRILEKYSWIITVQEEESIIYLFALAEMEWIWSVKRLEKR